MYQEIEERTLRITNVFEQKLYLSISLTFPVYSLVCFPCSYLDDLLNFFFLLALNLPVEFGVLDERVGVSISNEHFTAHTSKTFWVVLLLSSNLFIQGGSVMKHNAEAKGIILAFTR